MHEEKTLGRVLLKRATLPHGTRGDLILAAGVVEQVGPVGTLTVDGDEVDLAGYLLLPALVEPHTHLDKTFTSRKVSNPSGELLGAVRAWLDYRAGLGTEEIRARARAGALLYLAHGCTTIRSHVDAGEGIELRALEALLGVRDELAGIVDLELVALPTRPLIGRAGASNRAIFRAAVEMGADLVGGAPHTDTDAPAYLKVCIDLASEFSKPLDLHMDETLEPSTLWLRRLAAYVSEGFPNRVTASHCVSLGIQPPEIQAEVANALAAAGIGVVTCPLTNLYLQGKKDTVSPPRGLTALRALAAAGVVVAAAGDNNQDPFNPLGRCDPLQTAQFMVAAGHLSSEDALKMVGPNARAVLGRPAAGLAPGVRADLVALAAGSIEEALASLTEDRFVWSEGRLVARTRVDSSLEIGGL